MEFLSSLQDPSVIWGLFYRALGFMFFFANAQLIHQILPLAGSRGISPVSNKLSQIRRDYPGWRKWLYFPTLLWLNSGDFFLKMWLVIGSFAGLMVVYGGPYAGVALFVAWAVYLSYDIAVALSYPWDSVLFEAGFLGFFLPALSTLPEMGVTALPHPAVAFLYRLLLFRVIFGFGKFKFWKSNPFDRGYFRSFMSNIPLPTYPAWLFFRFPGWFFQFVVAYAFLVEVVSPFFIFSSSELRLIPFALIISLMLGIQLVSNFGFFNLVTIFLCIPLLDFQSSIFDLNLAHVISTPWNFVTSTVTVMLLTGGFLNFWFNSWCTHTWLHWPSALKINSSVISAPLNFYRAILRYRVTHAYGVFSPDSTPPMKLVPVIEGTQDGVNWQPYEYKFMTTREDTPMRFVAPFHPRWDHAIFYDAFGTNDANFMWSIMGTGNPYDFTHGMALDAVLQRILEGNAETSKLFRSVPFSHQNPPTRIRVSLYRFQPTTFAERKATGKWWNQKFAGTHLPERGLNPDVWKMRTTQPELFHWDAVYWRRWSPATQRIEAIGRTGNIADVFKSATEGLQLDLRYFWEECLPLLKADKRDWNDVHAISELLKTQCTYEQKREIEVLWGRLAIMLGAKLEPYYLGTKTPKLELERYFHFGLFLHHIIGKGEEAFKNAFEKPDEAYIYMSDFTLEKGLYFYGIFWCDTFIFHARKLRWLRQVQPENNDPVLPGFVSVMDFVASQFTEIGEEHWPQMSKNKRDGEWTIVEEAPLENARGAKTAV
jgi:hypothetical protein